MAKASKTEAKIKKAQARADADLEAARAKAERKIAKVHAALAVREAKIEARREKSQKKGRAKLGSGKKRRPRAQAAKR